MRFFQVRWMVRVAAVMAAWVVVASADGQVRLLVSDALNRNLYEVNTSTAATTLIGAYGLPAGTNVAGLAWDDASGTLFGSTTGVGTNNLYRISISTGAATLVGSLGGETLMHGLAAGPGGLYGGTTTSLFRINTTTAAPTLIGGYAGPTQMHGLDFNSAGTLSGSLGVVDGGLYTINPATGAATLVTLTTRLNSIAFHPITGELFGVANPSLGGAPSSLYTINPTTGNATLIGTMPTIGNALAIEFVVPGVGTGGVVVVGVVVGLGRRRRG